MNQQRNSRQFITTGFAIFSMYFGAGNLIFPPMLGMGAGDQWLIVMLGFLITGVSLPILGIVATAKVGGGIDDMTRPLGYKFSVILGAAISLCIGPFFAIPRTAATTFEIMVQPNWPIVPAVVSSAIFFAITIALTLSQSKVVDIVGNILTPLLLLILAIIMVAAVMRPAGVPVETAAVHQFGYGFTQGYQTMDAIGAMIMAGVFVTDLISKGYNKEEQMRVINPACVVAAICLAIIYGGLTYVGATMSGIVDPDISRVGLLIQAVYMLLGQYGALALGIAVALACLTTSIGLTSMVSNYFARITKIGYNVWVVGICVFAFFMSILGVEAIVNLAVNVLMIIYPVVIVIICLNLMGGLVKNPNVYVGAVIAAFVVSLCEVAGNYVPALGAMVKMIPLAAEGFSWLIPSIVLGAIFHFIPRKDQSA